jgi:porin
MATTKPMKNPLPAIAVSVVFTVATLRAESQGTSYSRSPEYMSMMRSPDWWDSKELTGDWGGPRNTLYDEGISIFANYTNNIAGNPVGGKSAGFTYCDNFTFGLDLDLEKLISWKGGTVTVSGLNRDGSNLSEKNIGNQFTVQQVFGGSAVMFYALYLDQLLWDNKISIKFGRFATGDDFASSPIYWLYMNNGIDGNPQALPVNTQFSAYPWAVWAARVRIDPTPEFNAMAGVYQVSDRIFNRNYHGLDWSMRSNDSILLISQIGWTPEFFKRPVPAETEASSDGMTTAGAKSIVAVKSAKQTVSGTQPKGLPGHYWFGAYWSPWDFPQFGSTDTATNSYGFYWHADQMIFQEAPGSDQGLTIWSAFVFSPQQNIAKLPFQVNGGLAYKGLVPTRNDDYSCFGVVYGKFSRNFARSVAEAGGGYPDYELVFEWNYKVQLTKFAFVQPDLQWVINPGGTGRIPNALVLGGQMGMVF